MATSKVWRHILVALIVVAVASTLPALAKEPMTVTWRGSQQSLDALERIVTEWGAERGIEGFHAHGIAEAPQVFRQVVLGLCFGLAASLARAEARDEVAHEGVGTVHALSGNGHGPRPRATVAPGR